jgi:hypothetical protein
MMLLNIQIYFIGSPKFKILQNYLEFKQEFQNWKLKKKRKILQKKGKLVCGPQPTEPA